jgi:FMN phosphatase YigB (HAD superfamily)
MGPREMHVPDRFDAVTLAFGGVIVDWRGAVESLLYDVARRHGESPMDRGRSLRRRLEELEVAAVAPRGNAVRTGGFIAAYEALVRARGYRWAPGGAQALRSAVGACQLFADVVGAVEHVAATGVRVAVVTNADPAPVEAALRRLDGAVHTVVNGRDLGIGRGPAAALVCALEQLDASADRVLHVGTSVAELRAAECAGVLGGWLSRAGAPAPPGVVCAVQLRTLDSLVELAAGQRAVAAG